MKELQPVNQNLILDLSDSKKEQKTISGLLIPDTAKEKPQMAPVAWMSVIDNAEVKPGDIVLFKPYSGTEIEFEGKPYLILPYSDVLAKIVITEEI